MKFLALLCLLFKSIACEVSEDYMLLEDCPIFANWSNIPHIDDMYRNISLLGVAVAEDDVVMMYKLIKDGCDLTYNDTAIQFYFDDDWAPWIGGQTFLHIASMEGSIGENNTKLLQTIKN